MGRKLSDISVLAQRIVLMPMTLIGTAVGQVFLAEASEMIRERPAGLLAFFNSITRGMALFAVALVVVGSACPFVFPLVFGTTWQTAGVFAALLSLSCAAQIVVSPISNIAILLQRQDVQLFLDAFRGVTVVLSLWAPAHLGKNATFAVCSYTVAMVLVYAISYASYKCLILHSAGSVHYSSVPPSQKQS